MSVSKAITIVHVAIPSPISSYFDYLLPSNITEPEPGARVCVPFARKRLIGIVLFCDNNTSVPNTKIRAIEKVLDRKSLLGKDILKLLNWASLYYVHPIGEVIVTAVPVALRKDVEAALPVISVYKLSGVRDQTDLSRAKQQLLIYQAIASSEEGLSSEALQSLAKGWRSAVKALMEKSLIEVVEESLSLAKATQEQTPLTLTDEQAVAVDRVQQAKGRFQTFLLNGVTGSGKTEVYLQIISFYAKANLQVLVIVPEISLTPQLVDRFKQRLACTMVTLHSQVGTSTRAANWLYAARGDADVVIGTRSAVFTPMPRLGLIIIDEEHDGSLKQQDGFRYHARDLSLVRARDICVPILLGSATPSLESLHNVEQGRFDELVLSRRAGNASPPKIALLDIRRRWNHEGISDLLMKAVSDNLEQKMQSLLFINRRGFAPVLICANCGGTSDCKSCDAHMTVHAKSNRLRCHHCGAERPLPKQCECCGNVEFDNVGQGTERIEQALIDRFPEARVLRIDRDTTRRKGELERQLSIATEGEADILVGTQMLAKGHHFPNLTLVGILDADRGIFGTDFRATEQMGQLITQVVGRAGRAEKPGKVLIQTRNPDHELLRLLVTADYQTFAKKILDERKEAELPPSTYVALLRAEATDAKAPRDLLDSAAKLIFQWKSADSHLWVLGPVVAPMERRGGRYRYQLMFQANMRKELNAMLKYLRAYLEKNKYARKIRWSIDVDPVDFF